MAWRCVNGLIIQLSYLLSTTATPALFNYGCENTRFVFAEGSRVVGLAYCCQILRRHKLNSGASFRSDCSYSTKPLLLTFKQ